jgi:hypothetical protein
MSAFPPRFGGRTVILVALASASNLANKSVPLIGPYHHSRYMSSCRTVMFGLTALAAWYSCQKRSRNQW